VAVSTGTVSSHPLPVGWPAPCLDKAYLLCPLNKLTQRLRKLEGFDVQIRASEMLIRKHVHTRVRRIGQELTDCLSQGGAKPDLEQKSRTPAWTDRILWRPDAAIKQLSYASANMTASDHKPVVATFAITVTACPALVLLCVAVLVMQGSKEAKALRHQSELASCVLSQQSSPPTPPPLPRTISLVPDLSYFAPFSASAISYALQAKEYLRGKVEAALDNARRIVDAREMASMPRSAEIAQCDAVSLPGLPLVQPTTQNVQIMLGGGGGG